METPVSSRSPQKTWWIVLLILVGLGVFFRLATLATKVFWVDEAFTALRISGYTEVDVLQSWVDTPLTTAGELMRYQFPGPDTSAAGTIRGLATFEPQLPPLYFILARWWVEIWGNSITVIRSFGAVVSLLTLPLLALLCRELFASPLVAYISVGLMAVSPFQVLYAQEARPYSLWIFLTVLSSWVFLRAIRLGKPLLWLLYGLSLTLSLYTFVYTVFVIAAHGLYVGWLRLQSPKPAGSDETGRSPLKDRTVLFFLLSVIGAVIAFTPWIGAIAQHWQQGLKLAVWQQQPLAHRVFTLPLNWALHVTRTLLDFNPDYGQGSTPLLPYGLAVLATLAGVGYALYAVHKTAPERAWRFLLLLLVVPAIGVILPDLLSGGQQSMASRYFAPCWVALNLVMAAALADSLQYRLGRLILAGVISLSVLSCATSALAPSWWHKQGGYIPYVARSINQTAQPLVVSGSDWWIFSLSHALTPETAVQIVSRLDQVPTVSSGFTHYFLYSMPPEGQAAFVQQGWTLRPFDGLDQVPIACLAPRNSAPGSCPPQPE